MIDRLFAMCRTTPDYLSSFATVSESH